MINVLESIGIQKIYLNIIKATYSILISKLNLNREKLKTILVNSNKTR